MPNDISEIRSTLNDLIETCKDSQAGFHAAAEKLKDKEIHSLFLHYYLQRSEFAGELQAEVTRDGGQPAESGTAAGAIHRGWIGLKTALAADSDHEILVEAERGEDAAVKNYIAALRKGCLLMWRRWCRGSFVRFRKCTGRYGSCWKHIRRRPICRWPGCVSKCGNAAGAACTEYPA